jgi:uncharacterized protein
LSINNKNNNNIWLLLDDRAGNCSQVLGIGKALNLEYIAKKFKYNQLSKLPNILLRSTIKHIKSSDRKQFVGPWPKIIIGCGRRSAPLGLWIKKQSNNYSKYIQIMWPSYPYRNIDIIFIPQHDNVKIKNNIRKIHTSPNIIDNELLKESHYKWKSALDSLDNPKIAIIIGGDTKKYKLKPVYIKILLNKIINIMNNKGSIMITTSRRTSKETLICLKKELKKLKIQNMLWDINDTSPNPYLGYLAHADSIVVTGDSISICSEVCATGKPLLIYAPKDITMKKHNLFHKLLIKKGIANYLENFNMADLNKYNYNPINESKNIATIIKNIYLPK